MNVDVRLGYNGASVIFERFGEEVVAIHLGTGRYYSLPGVAGDAFLLLGRAPTVAQLADALACKYQAPAHVIAKDLEGFLGKLQDESLIGEEREGVPQAFEPDAPPSANGTRLAYAPPEVHAHRDLENLFLVDPIHEVGEGGWPQPKIAAELEPGTPARFRMAPDRCLFEQFEDATVALNLNTGAYFSFSGVAEDILLLLHEAPTAAEIVAALAPKYLAGPNQIAEAVDHFLGRLVQADLIVWEELPAEPVCRELSLARPGSGLLFHPPQMEMYRDAPAAELGNDSTESAATLLSRKQRFRLKPDEDLVALAEDGGVAVQLVRGVYFILNATAAKVLRMLEQGPTASDIVAALERQYDVRRPELVASVIVLLQNLISIGVAVSEPVTADAAPSPRVEMNGERVPFEQFSVEMRHELREQFCLYPGGKPTPPEPASRGRQLASVLGEYFDQVSAGRPVTETRLLVAGRKLCIRSLADGQSADLLPAMSHLRHEFSGEPDLTLDVWNGDIAVEPNNWLLASYLKTLYRDWTGCCGIRGELRGFHSPALPAFYSPGPDILHMLDLENKRAFFLKRDSSPYPYWEAGSPFRPILHSWLSSFGLQFVHGGAVGENGAGVLLAGKGGSGKSTTTLLCLNAGMQYAGDDYCALEANGGVHVHSLYNSAKLVPQDIERFPELRPQTWNPQSLLGETSDKATFFLAELAPERMSAGFPLRAILLPRVSGDVDTRLTPCGLGAALAAIAPSTVGQLPNAGQADMDRMIALAAQLPVYTLHLGSDLAQIPEVVRSLLS